MHWTRSDELNPPQNSSGLGNAKIWVWISLSSVNGVGRSVTVGERNGAVGPVVDTVCK